MKKKKQEKFDSTLKVQKGIEQPSQINNEAIGRFIKNKNSLPETDEFVNRIINGDRKLLSQAITLIESISESHIKIAQEIIDKCLPFSEKSIRIAITGAPGVGKSTFIEVFGEYLSKRGKKVAVLAIDPSSQKSKGSILGDKTRMEKLSANPNAFIRPSPSAGTLGGVTQKTRESVILCEAAGFDIIIIETVGVGQSEIAARSMVDFFLLLQLPGAGDELQGIKRGIMEMVDAVYINKSEEDNQKRALLAEAEIKNALHMMPANPSGWISETGLCSALNGDGIKEIWEMIERYVQLTKESGFFYKIRKEQEINRLDKSIIEILQNDFYKNKNIKNVLEQYREDIFNSNISPYNAAQKLVKLFYEK